MNGMQMEDDGEVMPDGRGTLVGTVVGKGGRIAGLTFTPTQPAAAPGSIEAHEALFAAYNTWPADIRKKLSMHDLRRMAGWAPPSAAVPDGDKLTDEDVFTLIGDAHVRRGRGESDLPEYELDLARRIAVAIGDRGLVERCAEIAAAQGQSNA